jgi:murein DD-endopeptidase MepM/ murein hydrolase activator NlpD
VHAKVDFAVRLYPATNRLLAAQRRRKKVKRITLLLVIGLVALNTYLFLVRGLPLPDSTEAHQPAGTIPAVAAVIPDSFQSSLGQIRGVAGIRNLGTAGAVPGPHTSSLRFDLKEAQGVAGQRRIEQWCHNIRGTMEHRDTVATAMTRLGVDPPQAFKVVNALRGKLDFRTCRQGERFEILRAPTGHVERFIYRKSPLVSYRVERREGILFARKITETAERKVVPIGMRVKGPLYTTFDSAGELPQLVTMFVDIFAWDIDFYIDVHPDDTIRLLVEKFTFNGEFVRYGRILAAEYSGDIGVYRAFWYETDDGTVDYFDENGDSLRKAFLKSPLKFTNITSGFGKRVHPILGFSKMHLGVDLAAPRGTPIWAPGDGRVKVAGRRGVSGKLIILRHAQGYETIFAHLHTITSGIRKGARVRQKQAIGTVGSTGRSTGPHLHYGMKINGKHVNPFAQNFPPAKPVPRCELKTYKRVIAPLLERLDQVTLPPTAHAASAPGTGKDAG